MSGMGKRFIEANYKDPKPLIQVENKPIIEHIVGLFKEEDDSRDLFSESFVFIINNIHEQNTDIVNILKNIVPESKIYTVDVANNAGPVQAVIQIADLEIKDDDEDIIISYCDYSMKWDYNAFKNHIKEKKPDGCILYYTGFHPHMLHNDNYAFIKWSEDKGDEGNGGDNKGISIFEEIQEKKAYTNNKMSEYTSNGTYYFKNGKILKKYFQKLIDENNRINNEFYVSMVYNLMKQDGLTISLFRIEKMLQWGVPRDLEEYNIWSNYFLNRDVTFTKSYVNYETTLIIPMAGAGSRFSLANYTLPKPILPVEGVPMFVKAIQDLPACSKMILVCQSSHLVEYDIENSVSTHFAKRNCKIKTIDYITNGQATTCALALKDDECGIDLEKPLMISACDNGIYYDMKKYEEMVNNPEIDVIVFSFSNSMTSKLYPHMYAWMDIEENGYNRIKRVSIKKPFDDVENKYAIVGTMLFKKGRYFMNGLNYIYDNELKTNNEYYVDNMIEPLVQMGYKCSILDVHNYLCWGTPNDYQTYLYWNEYFCNK